MAFSIKFVQRKLPLITVSLIGFYLFFTSSNRGTNQRPADELEITRDVIHLAVVSCKGKTKNAFNEAINMIKSTVIFTYSKMHIHIFTEGMGEEFKSQIELWPDKAKSHFVYTIHPVKYPLSQEKLDEFKNWWGPCASFRLFLPEVLPTLDTVIYVDSDVLFLGPVNDLWNFFSKFNNEHVVALAPRVGWDFKVPATNPNFIMKPDGKLTQVNSGVCLMNLTRMRERRFKTDPKISSAMSSWNQELFFPLYHKNKKDMYGDQNLINTVFHYNPDLLYYLPCKYNYHHKFCFDDQNDRTCDSADRDGAAIVHGNAKTFYNNYSPAFRAINEAIKQYNFEEDLIVHLLEAMRKNLKKKQIEEHEHCGRKTEMFLRNLRSNVARQKTFSGKRR